MMGRAENGDWVVDCEVCGFNKAFKSSQIAITYAIAHKKGFHQVKEMEI